MAMHNSDELSLIVRLNIGGEKFCTTVDTLTQREPHSMLAAMFSGRHTVCKDSEGYVFLDRDGKNFQHILNWLRNGVVPNLSDSECLEQLVREAEYYQLLGLVDGLTEVLNKRRKDEEMVSEFTRTDIIRFLQSNEVKMKGVNLSGLDLSGLGLVDGLTEVLNKRRKDEEMVSEFTRTDIIRFLQSNEVKMRGVNLSGLDLSGLDLSGANFSYACLKNVSFSHASLSRASFEMADLTNANFEGANLEKANLKGAELANASLKSANLKCSYLLGARFQMADLTSANLERAGLERADLRGAKLTNANLKGASLENAYLCDLNLRETDLEGAFLCGADLDGAIR